MTLKTMKFFLFLFRVGLWKTIKCHWIYNLNKMYLSLFYIKNIQVRIHLE